MDSPKNGYDCKGNYYKIASMAKIRKDYTGRIFGWLKVLFRVNLPHNNSTRHRTYWLCECLKCGNIVVVLSDNLIKNNTTSCGCARHDDYSGMRFGEWTVLQQYKINGHHTFWECLCSCGNTCWVEKTCLKNGRSTSCGHATMSYGERIIDEIFTNNNINYKYQCSFDDLLSESGYKLRYDFGLLNDNGEIIKLIEYDGEQHFRPVNYFGGEEGFKQTQNRDRQKNMYAKNNDIPLLRIPYTQRDSINLELLLTSCAEY